MFGAVDLGSNSFRLHIGRHDGDTIRVVKTARDPIRLAAGLDENGNLTPAAIERALESLRGLGAILSSYPLDAVRAVATNTLRVAGNTVHFLADAEQALGYPIEIISGEEEGRLIYLGVANSIPTPGERRLVIDIGGGSTELILGRGQEIERVESFSIGTVRQSLAFFHNGRIDAASFDAAILSARSQFEDAASCYSPKKWKVAYGSSGTMRAIADAIAKNGIGSGEMTLKNMDLLKARLIEFGQVGKVALAGIKPERVSSVIGGLAILIGLLKELEVSSVVTIETGLRMGVMWDLYLRATQRDRREQSVQDYMKRFQVDQGRARHVAEDARALFGQLKPSADSYTKLLCWSALLHESGLMVSQTNYHKHGAYLIENADLAGFTAREQRTMSRLILSQKGNLKKVSDSLAEMDFRKAVLALRLAALFLHSRVEIDFTRLRLRMKNRIEIEIDKKWLAEHPTLEYWLEREQAYWKDVSIEFGLKRS